MSKSNFDQLLFRYLANQTLPSETSRIEELFDVLKERNVVFITAEGEELLYQEIIRTDAAEIEVLVDAMYELWTSGNVDFIFHASL